MSPWPRTVRSITFPDGVYLFLVRLAQEPRDRRSEALAAASDLGRERALAPALRIDRGQRGLRVANILLALGTQLLDQRFAVAVEAGVDLRLGAGRLLRLGHRRIELPLRGEAERHRVLRLDIGHVPVGAVADRGNGRAGRANQLRNTVRPTLRDGCG